MDFLKSKKGAAVLAVCLFIFLAFLLPSKKTDRPAAPSLGKVSQLVGEADFRLPATLEFKKLAAGDSVVSGELIAAHEAAQVTITFVNGASIRLQPGARLVPERDSSRADSVIATLLDGDADLIAPGTGFRLFKNGRDITSTGSKPAPADTLVVGGALSGRVFPAAGLTGAAGAAVGAAAGPSIVTASTPVDTPMPVQQQVAHAGDETGDTASKDSLSNDEIRKSMGAAVGFYRRCYLTYLNRAHIDAATVKAATVTVGFIIANSGKVHDAKVVRSDFNDTVLNSCVLETVERTPFRAFKAGDIPVLEFPIELK